jgi:serine/threonine-protein kinase
MGKEPAASTQSNNATGSFHPATLPQSGQELTADYQPSSADAPRPIRADHIGNYEILSRLGQGGMGEVYLARQKGLERLVALKLIRNAGTIHPELLSRFSMEAQALARFKHPNIVQVYEIGDDGGVPFISLEYIDGGSLSAKLRSGTRFDPRAAAEIIRVLAQAMATAHAAGILHRDIKPANILLNSEGQPKITDFGLAKWVNAGDGPTMTGAILGTPSYMAPEQAAGRTQDIGPQSDVYALGATLYELLTGEPPFRAENSVATVSLVVTAEPVPPRKRRPGLSAELEAICLKCLEKAPAHRYRTAEDLADDLGLWLRGDSTMARPLGPIRRTWRRVKKRRWAVGSAIMAVLLAVGAFAAARYLSPVPEQPALPDPDAVLKDYARAIAAGEPVTLIDKGGPPKWHRWALGKATLGESGQHNGVSEVQTNQTSLLELLPDPGSDNYRISAEFSITSAADERERGTSTVEAAIYFGYQEFELPDGFRAIRFFLAGIEVIYDPQAEKDVNRDSRIKDKEPSRKWRKWSARTLDRTISWTPEPKPLRVDSPTYVSASIPWPAGQSVVWRRLEVIVAPDRVEVLCSEGADEPKRIFLGTPANFARSTKMKREELEERWPGAGAHLRDWSPRMPLGIVVRNASVAVRNVTVKPLPSDSH